MLESQTMQTANGPSAEQTMSSRLRQMCMILINRHQIISGPEQIEEQAKEQVRY